MRPNLNNSVYAVESILYDIFTIVIVISGFLFFFFSFFCIFFMPLPAVVGAILVTELFQINSTTISVLIN